jgi:hypothetical protein
VTAPDAAAKSYYNSYSLPVKDGDGGVINPSMGSLIDVCGFSTDPKKVGQIRDQKIISEAIVAIPFVIKNQKRKFFTLPSSNSGITDGPSVVRQISLMNKYVIPPQFDFNRNEKARRIAMYIFEFKHKLDQDDLSHIWQNLPPKLGAKAEESYATVSHELFTNELMGDWKAVANLKLEATERSGFESEVRWMVFKAKQRAKTNYFEQIQTAGANAVAAQIPDYSYNWPYDFCSIVEMINIEPEIEFGVDEMKLRDAVQSKLADEAANWKGANLSSVTAAGAIGGTSGAAEIAAEAAAAKQAGTDEYWSGITSQRTEEWKKFTKHTSYNTFSSMVQGDIDNGLYGASSLSEVITDYRKQWTNSGKHPSTTSDGFVTHGKDILLHMLGKVVPSEYHV